MPLSAPLPIKEHQDRNKSHAVRSYERRFIRHVRDRELRHWTFGLPAVWWAKILNLACKR